MKQNITIPLMLICKSSKNGSKPKRRMFRFVQHMIIQTEKLLMNDIK